MKKQIIVFVVSALVAAQMAHAAPDPLEIHQRVFEHIKAVRDTLWCPHP